MSIQNDKIYLYFKDPNEVKYQYVIQKTWKTILEENRGPTVHIEYSNNIQDVIIFRKRKVLIVFGDTIVDMICNT